jgi:hypothetical protein
VVRYPRKITMNQIGNRKCEKSQTAHESYPQIWLFVISTLFFSTTINPLFYSIKKKNIPNKSQCYFCCKVLQFCLSFFKRLHLIKKTEAHISHRVTLSHPIINSLIYTEKNQKKWPNKSLQLDFFFFFFFLKNKEKKKKKKKKKR